MSELSVIDAFERPVHRRGADTIQPRTAICVSRRRERRAGELLRIQTVRTALRRIAPFRQRARKRLGCALVAEPGLITQYRLVSSRAAAAFWLGFNSVHVCLECALVAPYTPARAAAMASRSTARSPMWLARRRISLALTIWLCSSDKSRWV